MGRSGRRPDHVKVTETRAAITGLLTDYGDDVNEEIAAITEGAMAELVELTKRTAPERTKGFKKHIASETVHMRLGTRCIWYVKKPYHAIVHLIVNGHATKDGGRTKANPFLKNALDVVLPKYYAEIKEACQNAGRDS